MENKINPIKQNWTKFFHAINIILIAIVQILIIIKGIEITSTFDKTIIMYLSSTNAQVIAALFGLVVTGFIFFNDRLGALTDMDETMSSSVESLRKSYFTLLCKLSIACVLAIVLNIVNFLSNNEDLISSGWLNKLIIAASVFFTILSVILIVSFVWRVVNPIKYNKVRNFIKG
jgi:hypothetical protein